METTSQSLSSRRNENVLINITGAIMHARTSRNADTFGKRILSLCDSFYSDRQISCREGLEKPLNSTKTKADTKKGASLLVYNSIQAHITFRNLKEPSSNGPQKSKQTSNSTNAKTGDKRLQHLETIHQKTGVKKSLGITEGKRIRLDVDKPVTSTPAAQRPKKFTQKPRADLRFSPDPIASQRQDSDSDDLPEPTSLIDKAHTRPTKRPAERSSDLFDSDPDMDAIMLSVDTEAMDKDLPKKSISQPRANKRVAFPSPGSSEDERPKAKRQKTPVKSYFCEDTLNKALFLSSSEDHELPKENKEEPLVMDVDNDDDGGDFWGQNELTDTNQSNFDLTSSSATLNNSTAEDSSFHLGLKQKEIEIADEVDEPGQPADFMAEEYADLESWLKSGAVEITD